MGRNGRRWGDGDGLAGGMGPGDVWAGDVGAGDVGADGGVADLLARPAPEVAPRLLGAVLTTTRGRARVSVRITEVEAYDEDDPASHTFGGRTPRNEVMYAAGGHLYTYRSHGIHVCANVVVGPPARGAAVLLRGGVVVAGRGHAVERRGGRDGDDWLAAGPGRLCQALGIGLDDGGAWLLGSDHPRLALSRPWPGTIMVGPRVGVTRAPDRPWRWWVPGAGGVSTYRRSPRAPH